VFPEPLTAPDLGRSGFRGKIVPRSACGVDACIPKRMRCAWLEFVAHRECVAKPVSQRSAMQRFVPGAFAVREASRQVGRPEGVMDCARPASLQRFRDCVAPAPPVVAPPGPGFLIDFGGTRGHSRHGV
jgi:hypothetical protein